MNEKKSALPVWTRALFLLVAGFGVSHCAQPAAYTGEQTSVVDADGSLVGDTTGDDDESTPGAVVPVVPTERSLTSGSGGGTYPRLVHLADGTLLATFTRISGTTQTLVVARSIDGGSTFTDIGNVDSSTHQLEGASIVELPLQAGQANPTLMVAFVNHDIDGSGNYTYYRITICQSVDGGITWTFVSQAAEKGAPNGLWEPFMRLGTSGDLQLVYALENSTADQDLLRRTSTDKGVTWSAATTIAGGSTTAHIGVPSIAATTDVNRAAQVLTYETNRDGNYAVVSFISYDDGATWGNRQVIYQPVVGRNAGAPQVVSFADGSLAVVFMTDEDAATVNWAQNATVKVVFSPKPTNGIYQWSAPTVLSAAPSYWPGITIIGSNKAMAVYSRGGPLGRIVLPGSVP